MQMLRSWKIETRNTWRLQCGCDCGVLARASLDTNICNFHPVGDWADSFSKTAGRHSRIRLQSLRQPTSLRKTVPTLCDCACIYICLIPCCSLPTTACSFANLRTRIVLHFFHANEKASLCIWAPPQNRWAGCSNCRASETFAFKFVVTTAPNGSEWLKRDQTETD